MMRLFTFTGEKGLDRLRYNGFNNILRFRGWSRRTLKSEKIRRERCLGKEGHKS